MLLMVVIVDLMIEYQGLMDTTEIKNDGSKYA
jgi:hypothetical protein